MWHHVNTPKMKAASSFKVSVLHQFTCHIHGDLHLHQHHCENPKSRKSSSFSHVSVPSLFITLADNCYISFWQYRSMFNVPELTQCCHPTPSSEDEGSLMPQNTENVCMLFCSLHFLCRASQHIMTSDKSDVSWTTFYKNNVNNNLNFKRSSFDDNTFQHTYHVTF